ncbi:hypothetical protein GCM10020219_055700 [Nonomuraea dietziae]
MAVGDEFFVALRVLGDRVDVFLSDIAASWDYPLAQQVLEYLDVPVPDEDELDEILQDEDTVLPAGDLSIFVDLGLDEMELGILSGDIDLHPEDVLSSIAARLGFSEPFERARSTRSSADLGSTGMPSSAIFSARRVRQDTRRVERRGGRPERRGDRRRPRATPSRRVWVWSATSSRCCASRSRTNGSPSPATGATRSRGSSCPTRRRA